MGATSTSQVSHYHTQGIDSPIGNIYRMLGVSNHILFGGGDTPNSGALDFCSSSALLASIRILKSLVHGKPEQTLCASRFPMRECWWSVIETLGA